MRTLLIDADSICYAAACIAEHKSYVVRSGTTAALLGPYASRKEFSISESDEVYTSLQLDDFAVAAGAMRSKIALLLEECKTKFGKLHPKFFLTGNGNFRERLPSRVVYKHNRANVAKPAYLNKLRSLMQQQYQTTVAHWMEADDAIAIELTAAPDSIVASIDKDLLQLPGQHCVPGKGFESITKQSALTRLYTQILAGDATDGVPGCYRIGVESAAKLLRGVTSEQEMWEITIAAYEKSIKKTGDKCGYSNPVDAALETARYVYLLRKKPKFPHAPPLWLPPAERGKAS